MSQVWQSGCGNAERGHSLVGRYRLDPEQETIRLNVRVPLEVRATLDRLGGGGRGARSRGLRRLVALRTVPFEGDDAIVLNQDEWAEMSGELERLKNVESEFERWLEMVEARQ